MKYALGVLLFCVVLVGGALGSLWLWLPNEEDLKGCFTTSMYEVELCPSGKNYVPLKRISPYLKKAIVLTEDSLFYQHSGFDWEAIEKNAWDGWNTGEFKRGGSTITQQLAKNLYLNADRSFIRKGLEALVTWRIEKYLTKDEIYERYLNVIEFGKEVYGIKKAAQFYFHKSPSELNLVESAFIAMILPNPKKYSQSYYKKSLTPFAKKRMQRIIKDMYRYNRVGLVEYENAMAETEYFFGSQPISEDVLDPISDQEVLEIEQELNELNLQEERKEKEELEEREELEQIPNEPPPVEETTEEVIEETPEEEMAL